MIVKILPLTCTGRGGKGPNSLLFTSGWNPGVGVSLLCDVVLMLASSLWAVVKCFCAAARPSALQFCKHCSACIHATCYAKTVLAEHDALVCDAFTEMQLSTCSMHMKLLHDIAEDQMAYMIHLVSDSVTGRRLRNHTVCVLHTDRHVLPEGTGMQVYHELVSASKPDRQQ